MAIQKKYGKGRLDKWYKLAKEKGYRARAAFKLIQLNKRFSFLEKSKVLLDLCAAPGSWCQVAAEIMPVNSLIIGVDLAPIKPIPRCITFQSDITTDKCRSTLRHHLKSWKADTVLHDGAPNVGLAWVQDAFSQAELALRALKLATEFLVEGGTFVTKLFRSRDYNSLLWIFNQLFTHVDATKPPSSRTVSAEIFVVCRGYKCPSRIDPRLLDARSVFAELGGPSVDSEAQIFKPEKKKRKREGYEEDNMTQFKELPANNFIRSPDPVGMLASLNRLSFEGSSYNNDVDHSLELSALVKLPETTQEICNCCSDLKVLGRRDFKLLLKWRQQVRHTFGLSSNGIGDTSGDTTDIVRIEPISEDFRIEQELKRLHEQDSTRKKKQRRRDNEAKRKEVVRMQMHMTVPTDIGIEQAGPLGQHNVFAVRNAATVPFSQEMPDGAIGTAEEALGVSDGVTTVLAEEDLNELETTLDTMYAQYRERKLEASAIRRAKALAGGDNDYDDEWVGISSHEASETAGSVDSASVSSEESKGDYQDRLSLQASRFFQHGVFEQLNLKEHHMNMSDVEDLQTAGIAEAGCVKTWIGNPHPAQNETVKSIPMPDDESSIAASEPTKKDGRPNVEIITAEAMTLAHTLVSGRKTRQDILDDGFNRFSFRDKDGLPDWFLDDETKHSRPQRPTTAEAAMVIKEKERALNARPIKKVREAKARRKRRAMQRLEKLQNKSAILATNQGMSEQEKAHNITKLMSRAAVKKPKRTVKVVVARGGNKGLSGRPRGLKGRYKMVDARLKKDLRATRRKS